MAESQLRDMNVSPVVKPCDYYKYEDIFVQTLNEHFGIKVMELKEALVFVEKLKYQNKQFPAWLLGGLWDKLSKKNGMTAKQTETFYMKSFRDHYKALLL